jgi:cyclopropane-fatty-acyl-phospholipid synthase
MPALSSERTRLHAAHRILDHLASRVDLPLVVRLWDDSAVALGPGADADRPISIAGPEVLGSLLGRPTLENLFRHYVRGAIDPHGMDLIAAFELARRTRRQTRVRLRDLLKGFPWSATLPLIVARAPRNKLEHAFAGDEEARRASRRDDKRLVQFHYDVSNPFYELFLDPEMVYSCAYFRSWDTSLEQAQRDKLDMICRKLRLKPGETFLDIGCGWGALLCHAARHYGVRAHGVTLSQAQFDHAREKIAALGLTGEVTVALADYRSLEGRYDKIASIGMYEHVGIANYPAYFKKMHGLLNDSGIFLNHGITRRAKRDMRKFGRVSAGKRVILKYIFPGSELDHIGHSLQVMEAVGFEVHDVEGWRRHYARTCTLWYRRLLQRRDEAIAIVGPERFRMWAAYLAGVAVAFDQGPLRIFQTVATKRTTDGTSPLPPTREDLYRVPAAPLVAPETEAACCCSGG